MSLFGCSNGYQIVDGEVVYKTWNEGSGTVLRKLDADTATFEVLGSNNYDWARDSKSVFYSGYVVEGVYPSTFIVLNNYYGKNSQVAVGGRNIILEADVDSFTALNNKFREEDYPYFAKDKFRAYRYSPYDGSITTIEYDDFNSFEALSSSYARDKHNVYYTNMYKLKNALPSKIKLLNDRYITDGKHVYYSGKLMLDADAKTFKVTSWNSGKDKNYEFENELTLEKHCQKFGKYDSRCVQSK